MLHVFRSIRSTIPRLGYAPILLLLTALCCVPSWASDEASPVFDAHAAFAALKSLEGEWTGTVSPAPGEEGRRTHVVYEVSSNGHSVIQTFSPGEPHEMFSVYHMDGDDLLMTHYCAIGNAPKMKFAANGNPGELQFVFNGGTNLDPAKDAHAHEGTMRLLDSDHYERVSIGFDEGVAASKRYFSMRRQK